MVYSSWVDWGKPSRTPAAGHHAFPMCAAPFPSFVHARLRPFLQAAMVGGDEGAMERVGHMLLAGYGAKQDPHEAAKWLREAWWVVH